MTLKKIYQIADNHKKLLAQKTQDVVKNQVQYIEELEEDLDKYISPANQALFKIFEQKAQNSLEIPLDLFPKAFREYGKELKLILNIPNNFIVGGILAALSGAIGNSVKIYTKNFSNTASVFIVLVGGSGSGKTPAMEKLLKPLAEIEGKLTYDYKLQLANWKKNKDTEGVHSGSKPVKETLKIVGGNMEGILNRLQHSPKGMVIASDELAGFINSFNQYRKGNDLQLYLSIWSNQPVDENRKNADEGYKIDKPFISMIGGIQPGVLKKIIATIGIDDGFLWRCLVCINTVEKLPYYTDATLDKDIENNYINRVTDIYESLHRDTLVRNEKLDILEVNPFAILLSAEANLAYNDYCNYCRKRERDTPNDQIKEILGKIKIYCLRLALILHVADKGTNLKEHDELDTNTIYKAIELSEYFFEAMQQNFDTVSGENKNIIGIDKKYLDLYNSLPDGEFKRVVAIDEAKKFNIGQRMCCNFLKNNDYFKRTSYGKYIKTLDS
jgi:hypothetical protein